MHRVKYNSLVLGFSLSPRSPVLIKSGGISTNPSLPDMQFVRTHIPDKGESTFVPGSSLKGVLRSYSEKVIRSVERVDVCDIFDKNSSCSSKLNGDENGEIIYEKSCIICKVFGNQNLKGRISITDAYPEGKIRTEVRQAVAISRLTQAVSAGPFDMEIVVDGSFGGKLVVENFECWQIGLVALALNAFNDGLLKLGFGKNRGFGEVNINIKTIDFVFGKYKYKPERNELWGIKKFRDPKEDDTCELKAEPEIKEEVFFIRKSYAPEDWPEISERFIEKLQDYLR